jgi:hypothetical protein
MTMGASRVIYSISDLSLYVDTLDAGYVLVYGAFERGEPFTPIPCTTVDELERWFGRSILSSTDPLGAKVGLMQGAKFLIVRLIHCTDPADPSTTDALCSTLTVQDRGAVAIPARVTSGTGPWTIRVPAGGTTTGTEVENFTFVTDVSDKFKITVGAHGPYTVTLSGTDVSAATVAGQINAGSDYLTADVVNGKLRVYANTVTDNLVIGSVSNDAYTVLGIGEGTYAIDAGNNGLTVAIHGQSSQPITLDAGVLTVSGLFVALDDLLGAALSVENGTLVVSTTETGVSATITMSGTARSDLGFSGSQQTGSVGTPQDTLTFSAKNPGAWGDDLRIHIYDNPLDPNNSFDVRITYAGQPTLNEFWARLNMDIASDRYVVTYLNARSRLVNVTNEESINTAPVNRPAVDTTGTVLDNGSDGSALGTPDYIGDDLAQTGIYAGDKTDIAIDAMIPSSSNVSVQQALTAWAEDRGLVNYCQLPAGLDQDDALGWRNGDDPWTFEKWDNMHMFLEYGRPLVYDSRFDRQVEIPNLWLLAACISKNDVFYDYSHDPTGPRRGVVQMVEGLDVNLNDFPGYQDLFADQQVNYLEMTKSEGAVFWESYTTLIANSSMRNLNVVRFLLYMKRVFMPVLRTFLKEPNHPTTWKLVDQTLRPQLELWKTQGQIYSYLLQTDRDAVMDNDGTLRGAILNTGQEIQQGIYNARVLIQPTLAIRYFQFTVGVLATGEPYANFEEMHTLPGWVRK